jgi:PAS domain S-box-containing protein
MFDITILKNIRPDWVAMKANTALSFFLAGLSMKLMLKEKEKKWDKIFGKACAFFVLMMGFLTLTQYIMGWNIGIDQLLIRESSNAINTSNPGRMAPNTAFSFILIGLALSMLKAEFGPSHFPSGIFALIAGLIGFLGMIGYFYRAQDLYGIASFTQMAFHTSVTFLLLSVAILFSRWDRGLAAIITRANSGGVIARRLLPTAIVLPLFLGWVILWGAGAGFYGAKFGVTIFSVLSIIIFVGLVWWTAKSLDGLDIDRKKAERDRDRFFNMSMDMLCIAGFDGYFKQLNPAWEKTIGWKGEELLSKPYLEFIHPEDLELTLSEAQKLSTGEATITFENRYRCRDGSFRWLQWKAIPLVEKEMIYGTARDITERKQSEDAIKRLNQNLELNAARLEAANRELEAFAYSVSHDLRAPLRGIDGFSQALLEDYSDRVDAQGKDYLKRVREASQRMGHLIDDILSLSRVSRSEMRKERINLTEIANTIASELRNTSPNRDVEIVIAEGVYANGDQRLLRLVLENLLINAWKFTSKQPRSNIEFGITTINEQEAYYVRDNGAGFDMAFAKKLFGAFQRLHPEKEFPGTGIGLATVQRIIHRHSGKVWAEADVGKGATFYFTLP